jgi:hypothetical protein
MKSRRSVASSAPRFDRAIEMTHEVRNKPSIHDYHVSWRELQTAANLRHAKVSTDELSKRGRDVESEVCIQTPEVSDCVLVNLLIAIQI